MGMTSAITVVVIVVVYVLTGLMGVVARPQRSRLLQQVDPYLAILEYLIILAAVTLVVLMAAVYAYARPERKIYGRAALAFMIIFATLTCSVHFALLTVGRHIDANAAPELSRQLTVMDWPAMPMAVELLAWDFFFGLAMLFASRVFRGDRLQDYARASMSASGILCVVATLGPVTGNMRIAWLGIVGYAFVLPIACALLAVLFARTPGKVL